MGLEWYNLARGGVGVIPMACVLFLLFTDALKAESLWLRERHRGASWVAGPKPLENQECFQSLKEHHINWIVQTPFGWQRRYDKPELSFRHDGSYWGETDKGLIATARQARKLGIKTLLKPHIWLSHRTNRGKWRSDIAMNNEKDWSAWFVNYGAFMLHYAKLAQLNGIEGLCIGTELRSTVVRTKDWVDLIEKIRTVYSGELTYAANWYKEYEEITFWKRLDYIGIQAYFPLSDSAKPSFRKIIQGWQPHLQAIEAVQKNYEKPVIFTEVGYRNTADNAVKPWLWPKGSGFEMWEQGYRGPVFDPDFKADLQAQAMSYRALFAVFWPKPWFKGLYIWKWYPTRLKPDESVTMFEGFSPQNTPAIEIVKKWFKQEGVWR